LKICSGKCFLEPKHEVAHMYMLTDAMDEMVFKSGIDHAPKRAQISFIKSYIPAIAWKGILLSDFFFSDTLGRRPVTPWITPPCNISHPVLHSKEEPLTLFRGKTTY